MAEQATIEEADIEDLVVLVKESKGPVPLETLVERYVARLKERVTAETEATDKSA